MSHSTPAIAYQATDDWGEATAHGFLVAAHDYAKRLGLFSCIGRSLTLKMKTVDYSWLDKLSTLWASIVIGCNHTLDINCQLGAHEQALAAVFGFERFPDQSQINRLLTRFQPCHVEQWRALHLRLLGRHSRARRRRRWMRMANGDRVL